MILTAGWQGGLPVWPAWNWSGCWAGDWLSSRLYLGEQGAGNQQLVVWAWGESPRACREGQKDFRVQGVYVCVCVYVVGRGAGRGGCC